MIGIKSFEPHYRDGVRDLIVPIQRDEFDIEITYEQQTDLHDICNQYQKDGGDFWIAIDDSDAVVGSIALRRMENSEASLHKMFVAPDYRGQPHNVAQRLLTTLLDHARQKNLKNIYLGTTDKFLAAHRFYEKNGFARIKTETLPSTFPRMAVDSIFYKYKLPP